MNTIVRPAEAKLVRERSRFSAYAMPVASVGEVEERRASLRRDHHGARHIPYAYRLPSGEARSGDDGEPAGSAGRPLLTLLAGENLVGVLVAVARYFGGVKLGVGGLARAYRDAARQALAKAGTRPWVPEKRILIVVPPDRIGTVLAAARKHGARVLAQRFADRVELDLVLPEGNAPLLHATVAPWAEVSDA